MTTYSAQTSERKIDGKTISVVCLTPRLSADEKREAKLVIERRLYDIFYKYLSAKH